MVRTFASLAVVTCWILLPSADEAREQQRRGKNRKAEDAAKWVAAAGDHFYLQLNGCGKELEFTTDKKEVARGPEGEVFLISKQQAVAFVQVVVDCGLWERWEASVPGPTSGRLLSLGNGEPRDAKFWVLGGCSDDLASMFIFRHLLKEFDGERHRAVEGWLAHRQDKKAK